MAVTRVAAGPATGRRHRPDAGALVAIAAGGFFGGLARYEIGRAFPTGEHAFPWPILAINTVGAFALAALLVVLAEALPPTRYLRQALGTGFLGAFTTFSSVAGSADQLGAHGRAWLAAGYLVASAVAGLLAAAAGVLAVRASRALKQRSHDVDGG